MLGLGINTVKNGLASFMPDSLSSLKLWLDATDSTTLNSKLAASFSGTNKLSSASTDFQDSSGSSFTLAFWVDPTAGINNQYFSRHDTANDGFFIQGFLSTDVFYYAKDNGTLRGIQKQIAASGWSLIVIGYDSVLEKSFMSINNATISYSSVTLPNFKQPVADLFFGNTAGGYIGLMDTTAWWNKALTQAQITTIYNSGNGIDYDDLSADGLTSLVSWWRMNERSGVRYDVHSTNNLTESSAVSYGLGKVVEPISANYYVWRWADKSPNIYLFDQATVSAQPQYKSTGFGTNSKPYLLFDGVDDFLESVIPVNQPCTIFIAGQSAGNSQTFLDGDDATNSVKISKTATNFNLDAGTSLDGNVNNTSDVIITAVVNGATSSIQIGNNAAVTGDSGAKILDVVRLGKNNAGAAFLSGKINQILIYDGVLTSSQISQVKIWINNLDGGLL